MNNQVYEGHYDATSLTMAIVVSRFNERVSHSLVEGARDALHRHGLPPAKLTITWVPGAFELPLIARTLALSGNFDAIICLGAVIRGATDHYDYVCSTMASGIAQVGLSTGIPTIFGVLTTNTTEEALERAGGKAGNKGYDVAMAAIEMAHLMRQLAPQAAPALS